VGKWESCFWVSTFPPPTVFLSFWSSISFGKVFLELRQDSGKPAATWRDVQLDDHHRFYPRILLHILINNLWLRRRCRFNAGIIRYCIHGNRRTARRGGVPDCIWQLAYCPETPDAYIWPSREEVLPERHVTNECSRPSTSEGRRCNAYCGRSCTSTNPPRPRK
jgi:hypothetical protein